MLLGLSLALTQPRYLGTGGTPPPVTNKLVLEDGTSAFLLEDGTSKLILES